MEQEQTQVSTCEPFLLSRRVLTDDLRPNARTHTENLGYCGEWCHGACPLITTEEKQHRSSERNTAVTYCSLEKVT